MSVFLEWTKEELGTNVDAMDSQHKILIGIMNKLYEQNQSGADFATLSATVDELVNYTVRHFAEEEAYMESIGFEGLATHKIIHKKLLDEVGGHVSNFKKSGGKVDEKFFNFLRFWLSSHIRGIDQKYGAAENKGSNVA